MFFNIWLVIFFLTEVLLWDTCADTCGAPYQGEFYEDFHGPHSHALYDIDPKYMNGNSLIYQDRFCTKNNGTAIIAVLTSTESGDDVVLELIDRKVNVQLMHAYKLKPECHHVMNKTIYDVSNYKIEIRIKRVQLILELYRQDIFVDRLNVSDISACISGNLSTFLHLERGGMDSDGVFFHGDVALGEMRGKPNLHGNFEGCMADAMINGIPLVKASIKVERHDVHPACRHDFGHACTNACARSYIPSKGGNQCQCPQDSEINSFGLCSRSCNCISCLNGGSCLAVPGIDAKCKCSVGYKGEYCQISLCDGVVCQNNGSCSVQPSGPSCNCLPGFTGSRCEVQLPPDPCEGVACQNNGTCNVTELIIVYCHCLSGYYGDYCENQRCADQMSAGSKIGLAVLGGACFIGISIGIFVGVFKKRRRDDAEQSDSPHPESPPTSGPTE